MSVETLRKWMAADGLWAPRAERKNAPVHITKSQTKTVLVDRMLAQVVIGRDVRVRIVEGWRGEPSGGGRQQTAWQCKQIRQKQLVRDTKKLRSLLMNRREKDALSRSIEARLARADDGIRGTPTVDSILRDALEVMRHDGLGDSGSPRS